MSLFRYRLFQIIAVLAFTAIFGRLFYLQIIQGDKLSKEARRNQVKAEDRIFRGDIVDRIGKVLALDVSRYTLEYNPRNTTENRDVLAKELCKIVKIDPKLIYKNSSHILANNIEKEDAKKIQKLGSQLISLRKTSARFYPEMYMASQIIGYVDLYGKARKGIEAKFEKYLLKHPKQNLKLSIDSRLQALTEKALIKRIRETKAKRGTALVMDSKTGELLAWAVEPGYNPNKYFAAPANQVKNWSVIDVYQPGSIFKILTVSAALESKTVNEDYKFKDNGFIKVDNWRISNHDYSPSLYKPEELGLTELFARSSNPFAAYLAMQIGAETFYKYIKAFGIGSQTGIELVGESKGILKNYKKWRKSDIASTGIGQGALSATPLQIISAVNAVANHGVWVKPTLLKGSGSDNAFIEKYLSKNKKRDKRIISEQTADKVTAMLKKSIAYNLKEKHSRAGRVKGLKVAGKTGTAQKPKPSGGYYGNKTIASFIGYFDINNKRYISLVVIDDPETDGRWGDTVAGPLFNEVASFVKNIYSLN